MKRAKRIFWIVLTIVAAFYLTDGIVARVRPQGSVDVQVFYAVTRKDNRVDYSRGEPQTETCVHAALGHLNMQPCWYLEGHPRKEIEVGIQRNDFWRRW